MCCFLSILLTHYTSCWFHHVWFYDTSRPVPMIRIPIHFPRVTDYRFSEFIHFDEFLLYNVDSKVIFKFQTLTIWSAQVIIQTFRFLRFMGKFSRPNFNQIWHTKHSLVIEKDIFTFWTTGPISIKFGHIFQDCFSRIPESF